MPTTRGQAEELAAEVAARVTDLRKKLLSSQGRIKRLGDYFLDLEGKTIEYDADDCAYKREKLENEFISYSSIMELYNQASESDDQFNQFLEVETLCDRCSVIARKFQRKAAKTMPSEGSTSTQELAKPVLGVIGSEKSRHGLRLPPVVIPPFQGDLDKWHSFYDLFIALIDKNVNLSKVEKLYYLKSFLREEPLQLIDSLSLTNKSYKLALSTLQDRYDNRVSIINSLLRQLVDLKTVTRSSAMALREFSTSVTQTLGSLSAMGLPIESWDVILVFLICRKLDYSTHRAFELEQASKEKYATMKELQDFIDRRSLALENLEAPPARSDKTAHNQSKPITLVSSGSSDAVRPDITLARPHNRRKYECSACGSLDCLALSSCTAFCGKSVQDRRRFIENGQRCFNCLSYGHAVQTCFSTRNCRRCGQKHHTLLHIDDPNAATVPGLNIEQLRTSVEQATVSGEPSMVVSPVAHHHNFSESQILLATALVRVGTAEDLSHIARCMLDSASQMNFATEEFVAQLGLPIQRDSLEVTGLNASRTAISGTVCIRIASRVDQYEKEITCAVIKKITTNMPQRRICTNSFTIPKAMILADTEFWKPGPIQLLLGTEVFYEVNLGNAQFLGPTLPTLTRTRLGWIVAGPAPINPKQSVGFTQGTFMSATFHISSDARVEEELCQFWKQEEVDLSSCIRLEHRLAEDIFNTSCTKINHQYQVSLMFKDKTAAAKLGESYSLAARRFMYLERRLHRNPELLKEYKAFIHEYLQLGHASVIDRNSEGSPGYYMPHHCVLKESSTTRLRVVFDASAKTTSGYSLNDTQLVGSPVQASLFEILMRFRSYRFVFSCDIEKMYRQVLITPEHRAYQRILWRDHPRAKLQTLQLNTVTYGVASAPFLATRVLKHICSGQEDRYPGAIFALNNSTYVDDILSGNNSLEAAQSIQLELIEVLEKNGFHPRKWCSNAPDLLCNVPSKDIENVAVSILDGAASIKTLGLFWDPITDVLRIAVPTVCATHSMTKRQLLSQIMKIFDPLGLLGPVVLKAKLFMQEVWASGCDWDDQLPPQLMHRWVAFEGQFNDLKQLQIARWTESIGGDLCLHGFCDASTRAYGACFYITSVMNGVIQSRLICAKSRVAPLNALSVPRLELEAAVLLAKLFSKIKPLCQNIKTTYLYSDSQITLHRLQTVNKLDVLVAHRINTIRELTAHTLWVYVPTQQNPADCLSRGMNPSSIIHFQLWWLGPSFLTANEIPQVQIVSLASELSDIQVLHHETSVFWMSITERFSALRRLLRVVSYVRRYVNALKARVRSKGGVVQSRGKPQNLLTWSEVRESEHFLLRCAQASSFSLVYQSLIQGKSLKGTPLFELFPFIDARGVIRLTGRLSNSELPYDRKHPPILPAHNHFTALIFRNLHETLLHASPVATLQQLRLQYWPLGGRREAKRVLSGCVACFRTSARVAEQLMGAMPSERVTPKRAFQSVGLDFAGPVNIKQSRVRRVLITKGYIAVFVCMVTRAMHIELVSALSTESFMLALDRFISRRGRPSIIFSDNGTNFQGAANKLNEIFQLCQNKATTHAIAEWASNNRITWKFIPPSSPHMGGLWEAAVKTIKAHLNKVVLDKLLTFEEFYTILTQIEAILNSRPISALSDDPSDLEFLTPGHFLIQDAMTSYPTPIDLDSIPSSLKFWRECQRTMTSFWTRWSKDVLNSYQHRPKWSSVSPNITSGDLVLLKDDNMPSYYWKTARVVATIPGQDGLVRTARIRTTQGEYIRPITKLCPFPSSI